jgi:hypothetical protein
MPRKRTLIVFVFGIFLLSIACSLSTTPNSSIPTNLEGSPNITDLLNTNISLRETAYKIVGTPKVSTNFPPPGSTSESPQDNPTPSGPITAGIGEVVINGDLSLFFNGWSELPTSPRIPSEVGNKTIRLDFTMVYSGRGTYFFMANAYHLKDSDSNIYSMDRSLSPMYEISGSPATLFKGERLHLAIAYVVPVTSTGLVFVFTGDSVYTSVDTYFELGDQPDYQPSPESIPGEIAPMAVPLSSEASCLKIKVQIFDVKTQIPDRPIENPSGDLLLFLQTDVLFSNTDSISHQIEAFNNIWIQDNTGYRHGFNTTAAGTTNPLRDSTLSQLASGEKVRGWMGFTIPENTDLGSLMLVIWCGGEDQQIPTKDKAYLALK